MGRACLGKGERGVGLGGGRLSILAVRFFDFQGHGADEPEWSVRRGCRERVDDDLQLVVYREQSRYVESMVGLYGDRHSSRLVEFDGDGEIGGVPGKRESCFG